MTADQWKVVIFNRLLSMDIALYKVSYNGTRYQLARRH